MTTNHTAKLWGYGGSPTLAGQQMATRIKRLAPLVYDGMSPLAIRPYVVGPWPIASDAFGVAYPSGLLMVARSVGFSGSGSLDQQCENWWSAAVTGGGTSDITAVPQTLPVGYTRTGQFGIFGFPSAFNLGPPAFRNTQGGIVVNTGWSPRTQTNGDTFTTGLYASDPSTGVNGTFRLNSFLTPITADLGCRKAQLTFFVTYSTPRVVSPRALDSGSLSFTISHNADGSIGSSTGDLDTIDYTGTVTAAQLNGTLVLGSGVTQASYGPVDLGALSSPFGIPCRFAIRVTACSLVYSLPDIPGTSFPVTNWSASCQASLRCDIPFQCDIAGAFDLVAPGGYVP